MSSLKLRHKVLSKHIDTHHAYGLEIGPLDAPVITKAKGNVRYLDYVSYDELIKRHSARRNVDQIVVPDYVVSANQPLSSSIREKFDYIIACHVIEHVPNMIDWLKDLQALLNEGGCLFLAVPDKRYTFDILRPETSLSHLINDYSRSIKVPEIEHVFEHFYLKREVSSREIWSGTFQEKLREQRYTLEQAYYVATEMIKKSGYVDVHCHIYTYSSFKDIIDSLIKLKLINYRILGSRDVIKPYNEFIFILEKY